MSEKILQLNEEIIKGEIKELVRGSVEETLNELLEAEAEKLTQAARYERNEQRQGYRSGHYSRNLTTTSGDVALKVPRLKGISFETAIIERYRRRESSVEEALIEMYLAGVSVRRVEDITEALWGSKVSPATISELNKKAYVHIEDWRNRPLQGGRYPYVYVDGIYLSRNWGGEFENVAILVAIAVNEDGYAEIEQESDVKIAPMPNTNVIGTKLMRCKGFSYRQPNVDKFVVSDGITEIADHAFDKVGRIHHVIFPESVSVFGKNIFQDSDINIITILNSTPKFTSVAMIKSNVEWLEVMYGKKKIWIYLPNTCSAPRRSRVISSLTLDEEGHVKLDSSYIMVDQIGATDEFLRAYCLISQEELLEQVTLIYPDDTNKEKKLEWEKERLTDKLRQYMKQGAEYCLKNGILSLSDFEMLFKLGAITKTNVNYLMEFAAKYGQGDIVDFLFNTVKGGKGKKPEMIEVEKLSITYPHVINLTGNMYNGKAKNAEGISVGDKLILEADRDNPWFHPVAVEVFNSKKEPLGYLGYTAASNIIQQIADDLENIDAVVETVTPLSAKIAANPNTRSKSADMTIKLIKKC